MHMHNRNNNYIVFITCVDISKRPTFLFINAMYGIELFYF